VARRVGQQFFTASGRYTVVAFDVLDERDRDSDITGVIQVF
jgi:hypothetical protein